jgi:hypothetical protein
VTRVGREVSVRPDEGDRDITKADLRELLAELDAAGAPDWTVVEADLSVTGKLRGLKATAIRFGDRVPPRTPAEDWDELAPGRSTVRVALDPAEPQRQDPDATAHMWPSEGYPPGHVPAFTPDHGAR